MIRPFDSRWGYGWESNARLIPIFANSTQCYQASTIHWKIEHVWILVCGFSACRNQTLQLLEPVEDDTQFERAGERCLTFRHDAERAAVAADVVVPGCSPARVSRSASVSPSTSSITIR